MWLFRYFCSSTHDQVMEMLKKWKRKKMSLFFLKRCTSSIIFIIILYIMTNFSCEQFSLFPFPFFPHSWFFVFLTLFPLFLFFFLLSFFPLFFSNYFILSFFLPFFLYFALSFSLPMHRFLLLLLILSHFPPLAVPSPSPPHPNLPAFQIDFLSWETRKDLLVDVDTTFV